MIGREHCGPIPRPTLKRAITEPAQFLTVTLKRAMGCLPTCVKLQQRHIPVNAICPVCNEEYETIFHVLVTCPIALSCWNRSRVDVGNVADGDMDFYNWFLLAVNRGRDAELEELAMVAWAIWKARNEVVWQQKSSTAASIVASARSNLDQYKFAQDRRGFSLSHLVVDGNKSEQWSKPNGNQIKVNVDGALFAQEGRFGLGCLARDSNGRLIEAYTLGKMGRVDPEMAEIIGIKEALSWIDKHHWQNVVLESDSLLCVQAIKSNIPMLSQFGLLVIDVRQLLLSLNFVEICFVKRSQNKAASPLLPELFVSLQSVDFSLRIVHLKCAQLF
uniref:RNase H type-1 domain-containing protein n=1 Tax=Cannabis sativa TaxID=3483 RepID=A0A803QFY2_CANSA